jgi:uncharacterized protein (TIGR00369 family)
LTLRVHTHEAISHRLCGRPVELYPGFAAVEMEAPPETAADGRGLVHGGFVFGLADHAAMLAVDEPTVVLAAAEVKFLKPVVVGEKLRAEALLEMRNGRRVTVRAWVRRGGDEVLTAVFRCAVPERHVLEPKETG